MVRYLVPSTSKGEATPAAGDSLPGKEETVGWVLQGSSNLIRPKRPDRGGRPRASAKFPVLGGGERETPCTLCNSVIIAF